MFQRNDSSTDHKQWGAQPLNEGHQIGSDSLVQVAVAHSLCKPCCKWRDWPKGALCPWEVLAGIRTGPTDNWKMISYSGGSSVDWPLHFPLYPTCSTYDQVVALAMSAQVRAMPKETWSYNQDSAWDRGVSRQPQRRTRYINTHKNCCQGMQPSLVSLHSSSQYFHWKYDNNINSPQWVVTVLIH